MWCGLLWFGVVWLVWCGLGWFGGLVWCGLVGWFGWYGVVITVCVVCYGVVWFAHFAEGITIPCITIGCAILWLPSLVICKVTLTHD